MKHQAIVGNIGHFDNEIDMPGLARVPGIERINTNQVIAQIGLYSHTDIYEKRVYTLLNTWSRRSRGSPSSRPRTSKCRSKDRANPSATGIEGRVTALDKLVKIPIEWESAISVTLE